MARYKILIIEDDPLLVKMYTTKFSKEGYEVVHAQDGEKGWELVNKEKPDFIIMDVMMPKISGMQLLSGISKNSELAKIPLIMLSNLSQPDKMEKAKKLGAKEFLLKANYTPSQIVEKIKKYLG